MITISLNEVLKIYHNGREREKGSIVIEQLTNGHVLKLLPLKTMCKTFVLTILLSCPS